MIVHYLNEHGAHMEISVNATIGDTGGAFNMSDRAHREAIVLSGMLADADKKQFWIPPHRILKIEL